MEQEDLKMKTIDQLEEQIFYLKMSSKLNVKLVRELENEIREIKKGSNKNE